MRRLTGLSKENPVIIKDYSFLKNLRRQLRKRSTKSELCLWYYLRGRNLKGYKFRRQYGGGRYIVDFYCPILKLAIEIDGDSHYFDSQIEYDKVRSEYLQSCKVNILRFTNLEVMQNTDGVLEVVMRHLP